jgi:hypothetical protein
MLYYIDETSERVFRVPLNNSTTTPEVIYHSNNHPIAIVFNGDDLYISEDYSNRVMKMNINNITAGAQVFIDGAFGVEDMDIHENYLYMAEKWNMGVSRAPLDNPEEKEYVVDLLKAVAITFHDNMLYTCTSSELNNNTLYKVEVENWENKEIIMNNLFNPKGLCTFNDQILIAETAGNRILNYEITDQSLNIFIPGIGQNDEICRYGDRFFIIEANAIWEFNALDDNIQFSRLLAHNSLILGTVINENKLLITTELIGSYILYSLDLDNPTAELEEIGTVSGGSDLLINGEYLFIAGAGQVVRYLINDTSAEPVLIQDGLDLIYDMLIHEGNLYFTEPWEQNLYMVGDAANGGTSAEIIYTEENIGYLAQKNNYLYFTSSNTEWSEHYIKRVDLSSGTFTPEIYYQGSFLSNDIYMDDDISIYSSGFLGTEKLMRELHSNIGIEDNEQQQFRFEFSNPVRNHIEINNIELTTVQIIDINGRIIKQYNSPKSINTENLPSGVYILNVNNKYQTKIIKM